MIVSGRKPKLGCQGCNVLRLHAQRFCVLEVAGHAEVYAHQLGLLRATCSPSALPNASHYIQLPTACTARNTQRTEVACLRTAICVHFCQTVWWKLQSLCTTSTFAWTRVYCPASLSLQQHYAVHLHPGGSTLLVGHWCFGGTNIASTWLAV